MFHWFKEKTTLLLSVESWICRCLTAPRTRICPRPCPDSRRRRRADWTAASERWEQQGFSNRWSWGFISSKYLFTYDVKKLNIIKKEECSDFSVVPLPRSLLLYILRLGVGKRLWYVSWLFLCSKPKTKEKEKENTNTRVLLVHHNRAPNQPPWEPICLQKETLTEPVNGDYCFHIIDYWV